MNEYKLMYKANQTLLSAKALFTAIILAIFSAVLMYFTNGLWLNFMSANPTTTGIAIISFLVIFKYCLISCFIVSLMTYNKGGLHNMKDFWENGLISWLFYGLSIGLTFGLINWFFTVSFFEATYMLILGLIGGGIFALVVGCINESKEKPILNKTTT